MYEISTYIWAIFRVNVGKYSIHGASGHRISSGHPVDQIMPTIGLQPRIHERKLNIRWLNEYTQGSNQTWFAGKSLELNDMENDL